MVEGARLHLPPTSATAFALPSPLGPRTAPDSAGVAISDIQLDRLMIGVPSDQITQYRGQ